MSKLMTTLMASLFAMSVSGVAIAADAAKMDSKSMMAKADGDYKAAKAKIKGDSEAAEAQCKKMAAAEKKSCKKDAEAKEKAAKADAVIVGSSSFFGQQRRQIAELALGYRIPSMFALRTNVEAGGLISYGQNIADDFRRSATYVDKLFKGAKPGDLPVEQPNRYFLVINLKTAKALGFSIPDKLLALADEVIE